MLTPLHPGDLVFYIGDPANLVDDAIMVRTGGRFVHVEVVYDAPGASSPASSLPRTIGALASGVTLHPLPAQGIPALTSAHLLSSPARLEAALSWLRGQVGQPYGWECIADQGLALVPGAPQLPAIHLDCSALAADFLTRAGYPFPAHAPGPLALVSPVSLARAVGLTG